MLSESVRNEDKFIVTIEPLSGAIMNSNGKINDCDRTNNIITSLEINVEGGRGISPSTFQEKDLLACSPNSTGNRTVWEGRKSHLWLSVSGFKSRFCKTKAHKSEIGFETGTKDTLGSKIGNTITFQQRKTNESNLRCFLV